MIEALESKYGVSPYLCALASYGAYAENKQSLNEKIEKYNEHHPENGVWKIHEPKFVITQYDYAGYAMYNDQKGIVIVVHRGTKRASIPNWFFTNLPYILSKHIKSFDLPKAYSQAKKFSENIRKLFKNYEFIETGHSLGGMHAAINAFVFDCHAVTFDSPSMEHIFSDTKKIEQLTTEYAGRLKTYKKKFINYVSSPNLVNTAGGKIYGVWRRLYITYKKKTTIDLGGLKRENIGIDNTVLSKEEGFKKILTCMIDYDLNSHDIANILDAFDEKLGVPYLQAEIVFWPGPLEYFKWRVSGLISVERLYDLLQNAKGEIQEINRKYEASLTGFELSTYAIGSFLIPNFFSQALTKEDEKKIIEYEQSMLDTFDAFYSIEALKSKLKGCFNNKQTSASSGLFYDRVKFEKDDFSSLMRCRVVQDLSNMPDLETDKKEIVNETIEKIRNTSTTDNADSESDSQSDSGSVATKKRKEEKDQSSYLEILYNFKERYRTDWHITIEENNKELENLQKELKNSIDEIDSNILSLESKMRATQYVAGGTLGLLLGCYFGFSGKGLSAVALGATGVAAFVFVGGAFYLFYKDKSQQEIAKKDLKGQISQKHPDYEIIGKILSDLQNKKYIEQFSLIEAKLTAIRCIDAQRLIDILEACSQPLIYGEFNRNLNDTNLITSVVKKRGADTFEFKRIKDKNEVKLTLITKNKNIQTQNYTQPILNYFKIFSISAELVQTSTSGNSNTHERHVRFSNEPDTLRGLILLEQLGCYFKEKRVDTQLKNWNANFFTKPNREQYKGTENSKKRYGSCIIM